MVIRHAAISLKNSHALITIPNQEQGERDENLPDVRGPGGRDAALVPPVQRAAAGARVSPGPRVSPRSRVPRGAGLLTGFAVYGGPRISLSSRARVSGGARKRHRRRICRGSRLPDGPVRARPLPAGPLSARPVPTGPLSAGPLSARPVPAGPLSARPL